MADSWQVVAGKGKPPSSSTHPSRGRGGGNRGGRGRAFTSGSRGGSQSQGSNPGAGGDGRWKGAQATSKAQGSFAVVLIAPDKLPDKVQRASIVCRLVEERRKANRPAKDAPEDEITAANVELAVTKYRALIGRLHGHLDYTIIFEPVTKNSNTISMFRQAFGMQTRYFSIFMSGQKQMSSEGIDKICASYRLFVLNIRNTDPKTTECEASTACATTDISACNSNNHTPTTKSDQNKGINHTDLQALYTQAKSHTNGQGAVLGVMGVFIDGSLLHTMRLCKTSACAKVDKQLLYLAQLLLTFIQDKLLVADFIAEVLECGFVAHYTSTYIDDMELMLHPHTQTDQSTVKEASESVQYVIVLIIEALKMSPYHAAGFLKGSMAILRNLCDQPFVRENLQFWTPQMADAYGQLMEARQQQIMLTAAPAPAPKLSAEQAASDRLSETVLPDFRDISIEPSVLELKSPSQPPLQPNKAKGFNSFAFLAILFGAYVDSEHYLNVQFHLLREDFVAPLREAIQEHLHLVAVEDEQNEKKAKKRQVKVYKDVHMLTPKFLKNKGMFVRQLELTVAKKTNFMNKLQFGSLVALSDDDFKCRVLLATIEDRDDLLRETLVSEKSTVRTVRLGVSVSSSEQLNVNSRYVMVESPAYFEAYKHVLMGLKRMPRAQPIPFKKYLVKCETAIDRPKYQRTSPAMDLSCLMKAQSHKSKEAPADDYGQVHDLSDDSQWPSADDLGVDNSQLAALRLALRSELAVIQGPPGTGKTFIGYKLTQVLLENKAAWNPDGKHPILVVCFTNHALDQFLEGCLKFTQKLIRVGSRCKNEQLQQFSLSQVRNSTGSQQQLPPELHKAQNQCRQERKRIERELNRAIEVSNQITDGSHLLQATALHELMSAHVRTALTDAHALVEWLRPHKSLMPVESIRTLMAPLSEADGVDDVIVTCDERTAKLAVCIAQHTGHDEEKLVRELMSDAELADTLRRDYESVVDAMQQWPSLYQVHTLTQTLVDRLRHSHSPFRHCTEHQLQQVLMFFDCDLQVVLALLLPKQYAQFKNAQPAPTVNEPDGEQVGQSAVVSDMMRMLDAVANEHRMLDDDELGAGMDSDQQMHAIAHTARHKPTITIELGDHVFMHLESSATDRDKTDGYQIVKTKKNEDHIKFKSDAQLFTLLITTTSSMSDATYKALGADFKPNDLDIPSRWALYKRWVQQYRLQLQVYIHQQEAADAVQKARQRAIRQLCDKHILACADVLGMTTTGAAIYQQLLQSVQPKIVIMEEAAEVLEAHLVASLNDACEQVILIGDHKQLRPNPQVYKLAKKFNLDVSLFERLINNKLPYETLSAQHRMRPEMSGTLIKRFYDTLTDHESTHKLPQVNGMHKSMLFITHTKLEIDDSDSWSHSNKHEASWACELAVHLIKQDYEGGRITILCAYVAQMFEVKQQLKAKADSGFEQADYVLVTVVDNYQGEENDIVILSLVRSNEHGKIGFLKVPNRVCVALSRARHGIFILGNLDFLVEHCDLWREIADSLNEQSSVQNGVTVRCTPHGTVQLIAAPELFHKLSPEGGCMQMCDYRLLCGHSCHKHCHSYDPEHKKVKCLQQCRKKCAAAGHECQNKCYQCVPVCAPCTVNVQKRLPCGHMASVPCCEPPAQASCWAPCERMLPCGHKCKLRCCSPCVTGTCRQLVRVVKQPCAHQITVPCYQQHNLASVQCCYKMTKTWPFCGHLCWAKCHENVYEVACPQPCAQALPDCEHLCSGTCGTCKQGRLHVKCKKYCRRVLVCGHKCTGKCGLAGCAPCSERCETQCEHSTCADRHYQRGRYRTTCGQPCAPCLQPCDWKCKHHRCDLKCNEPCKRPVCVQPCGTQLKCGKGHMCAGVCNGTHSLHNCPTITINGNTQNDVRKVFLCATCHADKWKGITAKFLGNEQRKNALFVQLDDCGCILESSGLDAFMRSSSNRYGQFAPLRCPRCQTVVRTSGRFGTLLKQRAIEVEQIKCKVIGLSNQQLMKGEQSSMCTRIKDKFAALEPIHKADRVRQAGRKGRLTERPEVTKHNADRVKVLRQAFTQLHSAINGTAPAQLSAALLSQWDTLFNLLVQCQRSVVFDMRVISATDCEQRANVIKADIEHLQESKSKWEMYAPKMLAVWAEFTDLRLLTVPQSVVQQLTLLMNWMVSQQLQMSNSQMQQINQILNQLELLALLASACSKCVLVGDDIDNDEQRARLRQLLKMLYSNRALTPHIHAQMKQQLHWFMHSLQQPAIAVQYIPVARPIGYDTGHWFKCDQCCDMYSIGNGERPTQRWLCAKCKAARTVPVDGQGFKLVQGNSRR